MPNLEKKKFKKGTNLITENDLSRKLFILRSGKVVVYKDHLGGRINLAVLGPGEIFGELSFFDAKKRSASVVAATDIVADCIDGESLVDEIEKLPGWVHLIFKSVAERFRRGDEKMMVLQSIVDFQEKNFSPDMLAVNIYSELLRYIKIVHMLIKSEGNSFDKNSIVKSLGEVTGKSIVSAKGFIRGLNNNAFFDSSHYHLKNRYEFIKNDMNRLESFLQEKHDSHSCTILTTEAIGVLKKIISSVDMMSLTSKNINLKISQEALPSKDEVNLLRGYGELLKLGLLTEKEGVAHVMTESLIYDFRFYMLIKAFDQASLLKEGL